MWVVKLYTSVGFFIGEVEFDDIEDALENVKGHISSNDTVAIIGDKDYIESFNIE